MPNPKKFVDASGLAFYDSKLKNWVLRNAGQPGDWNENDPSSKSYIANKPTIPTSTSDLTNDSGFITLEDIPEIPTGAMIFKGAISSAAGLPNSPEIGDVYIADTSFTYNNENIEVGDMFIYQDSIVGWKVIQGNLDMATIQALIPQSTTEADINDILGIENEEEESDDTGN